EGDQYDAAAPVAGAGARQLEFLFEHSGAGSEKDQSYEYPTAAGTRATVRVFWSLLGLRRNPISETANTTVWRSDPGGQCHRLVVDLWWEPADNAVEQERGRARSGMVKLTVRR